MSAIQKIMITRQEGGEWEIIPIHSIVIQGMRWDAKTDTWSLYPHTVDEIEDNQAREVLRRLGRPLG